MCKKAQEKRERDKKETTYWYPSYGRSCATTRRAETSVSKSLTQWVRVLAKVLAVQQTHPVPAKALLRAEETVLHAELQASRALKRAGIVAAVAAGTRPLCFVGHGDEGCVCVLVGEDGVRVCRRCRKSVVAEKSNKQGSRVFTMRNSRFKNSTFEKKVRFGEATLYVKQKARATAA